MRLNGLLAIELDVEADRTERFHLVQNLRLDHAVSVRIQYQDLFCGLVDGVLQAPLQDYNFSPHRIFGLMRSQQPGGDGALSESRGFLIWSYVCGQLLHPCCTPAKQSR